MLGYYNNQVIVAQLDPTLEELKKAIAASGGSFQQYRLFENLLRRSLYDIDTRQPFHDTRAGQSLLFLFPMKVQVFLSILLYNEEVKIYNNYVNDYNVFDNIQKPGIVLSYNASVTKRYISEEVIQLLDFVDKDLIINDDNLKEITEFFSVDQSINALAAPLNTSIPAVFSILGVSNQNIETYQQIALNNDRVSAAVTLANALNFKTNSITRISFLVNQWLNQNSNI